MIGWVNDGFMAVAIGEDYAYGMGYRWGDGANTIDAVNTAKRNLAKHRVRPLSRALPRRLQLESRALGERVDAEVPEQLVGRPQLLPSV